LVLELQQLLGTGRAKNGIFEGDLQNGELEIGQISARINELPPAAQILKDIWEDYQRLKSQVTNLN